MTPVDSVERLQVYDVVDAGVPNQERFGIYVRDYCDLSKICVVVGARNYDGSTVPVRDQLLWLGHGLAYPGDWIIVYTAAGTTTVNAWGETLPNGYQPRLFSVHWGKDHTIFQNRGLVPMILEIAGSSIPEAPEPQYQGARKIDSPRKW
jgi:hypothetical protein